MASVVDCFKIEEQVDQSLYITKSVGTAAFKGE